MNLFLHLGDARGEPCKERDRKHGHAKDDQQSCTNSLVHMLFGIGSQQRRDSVSGKFDFDVFGNPELNSVVFESDYRTVNSAGSDDLIAGLQIVDHVLQLLLPAARRQKDDQVKDAENEYQWQERSDAARRLGLLLKKH